MIKVTKKIVQSCFHKRKTSSHKGQNGRVLVIGGSEEFAGAPTLAALSAKACLRAGVDIVYLFAPQKVAWAANCFSPDLITFKAKGNFFTKQHVKKALDLSKKADVVVLGNGIGFEKPTIVFVKKFIRLIKTPLVVDADAIKALSDIKFRKPVILTPHLRELEIFFGQKITNPKKQVKEIARKHNCIVLLKGKVDYISDGKKLFYNVTGNSGMTVGGTGDVLAGICGALLAHKNPILESAASAAFINGIVGDRLLKKKGIGFTATDFVEEMPFALKKFWNVAK